MFSLDDKIQFQTKSNDILTVGELFVDMISAEYDESFESNSYNRFFGGSPSNIAMNVKKIRHPLAGYLSCGRRWIWKVPR